MQAAYNNSSHLNNDDKAGRTVAWINDNETPAAMGARIAYGKIKCLYVAWKCFLLERRVTELIKTSK
jgi:hypothetical protein